MMNYLGFREASLPVVDFAGAEMRTQEVSAMGMETCCTLGLLNAEQAKELKNAGLTELQLR